MSVAVSQSKLIHDVRSQRIGGVVSTKGTFDGREPDMNLPRGSRVALYVRVSTSKQVEHGHSLDDQRERLTAYANERGMEVAAVIVDEGESGSTMQRPGMAAMLGMVDEGSIDCIVTSKADRISRSLRDLLNLTARLDERGVGLLTIDEQVDTSSPLGKAMAQMRGVFAELERELIRSRTRAGMQAAKAKGVRLGRPCVGWSVVNGAMVPNDRYPVVARAHELRAGGLTMQQVADTMNTEGFTTGSGFGKLAPPAISRLLRSPLAAI